MVRQGHGVSKGVVWAQRLGGRSFVRGRIPNPRNIAIDGPPEEVA